LITRLLDLILRQDDPERSFVKFKQGDELVLLVNNQGGMSALEMGAVVDETLSQLGTSPNLLYSSSSTPYRKMQYSLLT
jgi:dihydroxyacetone kinase